MPYSGNSNLPSAVRNSLSDADQTQWRKVFNSAYEQYGDDKRAAKVAWAAVKKSESCRYFSGWASVEEVDKQGDLVKLDGIEKVMDAYIDRGGPVIDSHSNRTIGHVFDYEVKGLEGKKGLYIHCAMFQNERLYDEAWKAIKAGDMPAFSIGADGTESQTVCDEKTCWHELGIRHMMEISTCAHPANESSYMQEVNATAKFIEKTMDECNCNIYSILKNYLSKEMAKEAFSEILKAIDSGNKEMPDEKDKPKAVTAKVSKEDEPEPNLMEETLSKMLAIVTETNKSMSEVLKFLTMRAEADAKPDEEEEKPKPKPEEEEEKPKPEEKSEDITKQMERLIEKKLAEQTERIRKAAINATGVETPAIDVSAEPDNPIMKAVKKAGGWANMSIKEIDELLES